MSNFPKPHELEDFLEACCEKLEDFNLQFNPNFLSLSEELKAEFGLLRTRIEKYAHFSRDHQLEHLNQSESAQSEIQAVYDESQKIKSKFEQLERMHRFKQQME